MSHGGDLDSVSGGIASEPNFDTALRGYKRDQVDTFVHGLETENAALAARLTAVDIIARRLTAAVLLIRALGGDWNSAIGDPHTG